MSTMTCTANGCRTLGQHTTGCVADTCRGCLPRLAGDGIYLCLPHRDRLATNAAKAAELYEELAFALAPNNPGGPSVSGTKDRGIKFNPRAADSRTAIKSVLTAWCKLVVDMRGFTTPADTVHAMAAYIGDNATWLAAYPAADDCSDELKELAYGEPWRVAFPSNARVFDFSACPIYDDHTDLRCAGTLRAIMRRPDYPKTSEIICDTGDHRWAPHQWMGLHAMLTGQGLAISTLHLGAVA